MSTYSSPGDEITGSEDIIRKSDVLARIDVLKPWYVDHLKDGKFEYTDPAISFRNRDEGEQWRLEQEDPGSIEIYEDDTDSAELFALQELLADFSGSDSSYMVHADFLEEYAQEEASDIAGDDASYLFSYVDWETLADDMKADMKPVDFRHNTYWLVSR